MKTESTISLCMIVKDEETYLPLCLESVKDVVDEIVIVDTGSTDNTQTIAKQYGAVIYDYEWNNSFAEARNFAISKATCEWLLLLDADEVIDFNDASKLKKIMTEPTIDGYLFALYNYTGTAVGDVYTIHHAVRMVRNHAGYQYKGAIHEQMVSSNGQEKKEPLPFEIAPVKVHHYGYLDDVVKEHKKRERNLPLIEQELQNNPKDSYFLFMLANEYLSEKNHEKGLEFLLQAKENFSGLPVYSSALYYRLVLVCTVLRKFKDALAYADEILAIYPKFTNVIYQKAIIYYYQHRYTLAIDMLNTCIHLGEAPAMLTLVDGTGTYKSHLVLADIYKRLHDYDRAIANFTIAYHYRSQKPEILSEIAYLCLKKYDSRRDTVNYIFNLAGPTYEAVKVLLDYSLYQEVVAYIKEYKLPEFMEQEQMMLETQIALFTGQRKSAHDKCRALVFNTFKSKTPAKIRLTALKYLVVLGMLNQDETLPILMTLLSYEPDGMTYKVYSDLYALYKKEEPSALTSQDNAELTLPIALEFLDILIKLQEFETFENYLYILNRIESTKVLIELAKVYDKNGYATLAQKTLIKSLTELNVIDGASLDYLANV